MPVTGAAGGVGELWTGVGRIGRNRLPPGSNRCQHLIVPGHPRTGARLEPACDGIEQEGFPQDRADIPVRQS